MGPESSALLLIAVAIASLTPSGVAATPASNRIAAADTFAIRYRDPLSHSQFNRALVDADEIELPSNKGSRF